jgi:hypothetical protein
MNPTSYRKTPGTPNPDCVEVTNMAEKELAAFFGAVTSLFGSEQAGYAADDWLNELDKMNGVPASARDWRSITANVTARLVIRLKRSTQRTHSHGETICMFLSEVPLAS